jgi:uncharacterized protein YjbI with pentapeptide repeats
MEMMGEVRPPARLNTTIVLPSNPTLRWKRKFFNYLIREADLRGMNLTGANLCQADLFGAKLAGANLTSTVFHEAQLLEADLVETADTSHS